MPAGRCSSFVSRTGAGQITEHTIVVVGNEVMCESDARRFFFFANNSLHTNRIRWIFGRKARWGYSPQSCWLSLAVIGYVSGSIYHLRRRYRVCVCRRYSSFSGQTHRTVVKEPHKRLLNLSIFFSFAIFLLWF